MRGSLLKSCICLLLCCLALWGVAVPCATADGTTSNTSAAAKAWVAAAKARSEAAANHQSLASTLLEQAAEWRTSEYLYDSERKKNFEKAGDYERKAGDLEDAACTSLLKAAANWNRASALYGDSDEEKSLRAVAEAESLLARTDAVSALEAAVANYVLAADAFGEDNADAPKKRDAAIAKAETARKRIETVTPTETETVSGQA